MRALTDFLLRESLALLLDDPTPRRVALAMGEQADAPESQSQLSEDSESQSWRESAARQRVLMVRKTDSARQRVSLVDRRFAVEAFVPARVADALCRARRYQSLARLRGSVVRVDQYHFATPAQCRAMDGAPQQPTSVSMRQARREGGGDKTLWLVIEALTVIDDSELAVNPMPALDEHDAVVKQLQALTPAALAQRLALRQGLSVDPTATTTANDEVTPSPAKQFGAHVPLLAEDLEIPEEQEREMEEQEGWGVELAEPTDSQLIAENGPVSSGGGESQLRSTSGNTVVTSSSSNTVVSSSSDAVTPDRSGARIVVLETEPQSASQGAVLSSGQTPADGSSVPDSQDFHFQQVNLKKALVDCSDTDSDNEEYVLPGAAATATAKASASEQSQPSTPSRRSSPSRRANASSTLRRSQRSAAASSQSTESQSLPSQDEPSQQPLTQAPALSGSFPPASQTQADDSPTPTPASQSEASQVTGEFVGVVRADHDEPMTQVGDESQVGVSQDVSSAHGVEWNTQAPDASQPLDVASDQETVDVEYEMGGNDDAPAVDEAQERPQGEEEEEAEEAELEDRPTASQQDGQADHWMDTQPNDASSSTKSARSREPTSPRDASSPNASQRRKRRRTLGPSDFPAQTQPLSLQGPREESTRTNKTAVDTASASRAHSSDADAFASFMSSNESVAAPTTTGISAFSRRAGSNSSQRQRQRPSKRYQHLLPPFDLDAVRALISNKKD